MMEFIQDLHEARLTRNSYNQKSLTYSDCCERLYLTVLIIELLRRYKKYSRNAQRYAKDTSSHTNYDHFRMYGTDLYNFIYFVNGDDAALEKLKDPEAAKQVRERVSLPVMGLNRYLSKVGGGSWPAEANQFMVKLESSLLISNSDYKNIRRGLSGYESLDSRNKKALVTKLLYAARAKLRNSDIIDDLEALAAEGDLEVGGVRDTEPNVSVPDITTGGVDLNNYRFLVGAKNVMMVKKFLERAKNGQSAPQDMVRAYLEVIKMVDNIVRGGPAFIQQLKLLEKRAKNSRK
jgi:hypothetical protein